MDRKPDLRAQLCDLFRAKIEEYQPDLICAHSHGSLISSDYDKIRAARRHLGPYLPVVLEACRGDQFSYECRQGVASYGAFTYSLVHNLRRRGRGGDPSFKKLTTVAGTFLRQLRYNQTPQIVGPKAELEKPIP